MAHLLPAEPVQSLDDYVESGGGRVLERCDVLGRAGVLGVIRDSGLRGRGGAGFPTGIKWAGVADSGATRKFVVCNAAEGEPGTFKDRLLLRRNPYQVLEGIAAAVYATAAESAFIGIKAKFDREIQRLESAAAEMSAAGLLGDTPLTIVHGPDDYLFGEEKALLEVIEGKDPLPRLYPPYAQGLFEGADGNLQPAVVNNVETLSNAAHIIVRGADWYRSIGTEDSPGTMICTISGDVAVETVAEVEMGTPLGTVIDAVAGGTVTGRPIAMVLNGVSSRPIPAAAVADVPISFEGMRSIGSSLGSASFMVYDDRVCPIAVGAAASAFLFRGSCGQCPPCKMGTAAITERFAALSMGGAGLQDVAELAAWAVRVTDANRCGLGAGQRAVAEGIRELFPDHIAQHVAGDVCVVDRPVGISTIEDWDEEQGVFRRSRVVLDDAPGA